jgi:CheY-like chemotaxis protein
MGFTMGGGVGTIERGAGVQHNGPAQPQSTADPATTQGGANAAYVLIVDDDADIRMVVTAALEDEGYRVGTAANGQQALDRVAEQHPDLVLLDLTMPVMNGWECHSRLRELAPDVPVVFMTAAFRAKVEAESHGAAGHLSKPFEIDDLVATVERFAQQPPV